MLSQTTNKVLSMLKKLIAAVRSPKEKPNQPNVEVLTSPETDGQC